MSPSFAPALSLISFTSLLSKDETDSLETKEVEDNAFSERMDENSHRSWRRRPDPSSRDGERQKRRDAKSRLT
jgi:hypothetical protein